MKYLRLYIASFVFCCVHKIDGIKPSSGMPLAYRCKANYVPTEL